MAARRARGEDGISFEHRGGAACRDPDRHRRCQGLWRGEITLGYTPDGKRVRRKVSRRTKAAVKDALDELRSEAADGVRTSSSYTLQQAVEAWLSDGLSGRSNETVAKYRYVLKPVLARIGGKALRELTAADVRAALTRVATSRSTETVAIARLSLERAIRHAEGEGLVRRNVAAMVETPKGQAGRPSKSLTMDQAMAVLDTARSLPAIELRAGLKDVRRPAELMYAYIMLCLVTGIRTEEARALRWDHVYLDGDPPFPPNVAVWRSVRLQGETKTRRSRRTLALPQVAVFALRLLNDSQQREQSAAGQQWSNSGLVFTTRLGKALDAGQVRKMFKRVCASAGIGEGWTPRELRTSFVSLMSHRGVSIEDIARLAGHTSSRTTEVVYRRELRPVITTGAEIMDEVFRAYAR
jgi:integrase